jgi:hypothetical protein
LSASRPDRVAGGQVAADIDELVRKFGGNLRQWPDFPHAVAEGGQEPQDVTDERLAAASLHLHQRGEQFRDAVREANADGRSERDDERVGIHGVLLRKGASATPFWMQNASCAYSSLVAATAAL